MSAAEMAALGLGAGAEAGQGNAGRAGLALRSREEAANDLGAAVAEWLQFHDLGDTLKALDEEVRRKPLEHSVVNLGGARGAGYGDVERESLLAALTVAFDEGRCGQFFSLWARGVPAHVRHQSLDAHRAEFYLRVYFAVYPSHPAVPADKRAAVSADGAMGTLREWLATTGAHLAKTSEFVPYYALPYVPDAASHPAFARVFEPAFPSTVRQMALDFFAAAPLVLSAPKLYAYYSAYFGLGQGGGAAGRPASATNGGKRHTAAAAATARPGTAFLEGREGLEAYAPTDADIRSSIRQVAREEGIDPALVDGHDAGGSQKQASARADPHAHMRLRTRTHEDRSRPSTSTHRGAPSDEGAAAMAGAPEATLRRSMPRALGAEMEGAAEAQHHQHEVSLGAQLQAELQRQTPGQATASFGAMSAQQQSEAVVDCDATRKTLGEGSARDACDVLQALRLRIARAPPGRARARAALPLALGDALGVLTGAFSRVAVELRSPAASEQLARLADLLAGDPQWRALLADASDDAATCALASLAMGDATSLDFAVTDATRAHALSALQRATLSPRVASAAARAGVVPWTASMLQKLDASDSPMAARSLEYAASLLMNVSLRAEGRRAAADAQAAGADVLGALVDHLESESRAVRAYVNGALYSALRARGVRGAARDIGLGEVLALVAQRSDDVFAAQVRCIALRLERYEVEDAEHEGDGDVGEDDDDDEDDNADYLVEAELASEDGEEGASVEAEVDVTGAEPEGLVGEALLAARFRARTPARTEMEGVMAPLLPPEALAEGLDPVSAILASLDRRLTSGEAHEGGAGGVSATNGSNLASGGVRPLSDTQIRASVDHALAAARAAAPLARPVTPAGRHTPVRSTRRWSVERGTLVDTPYLRTPAPETSGPLFSPSTGGYGAAPSPIESLAMSDIKSQGPPPKPVNIPEGARTGELEAFAPKSRVPRTPA